METAEEVLRRINKITNTKPMEATVVLKCDVDSLVIIDQKNKISIKGGKAKTILVPEGKHNFHFSALCHPEISKTYFEKCYFDQNTSVECNLKDMVNEWKARCVRKRDFVTGTIGATFLGITLIMFLLWLAFKNDTLGVVTLWSLKASAVVALIVYIFHSVDHKLYYSGVDDVGQTCILVIGGTAIPVLIVSLILKAIFKAAWMATLVKICSLTLAVCIICSVAIFAIAYLIGRKN